MAAVFAQRAIEDQRAAAADGLGRRQQFHGADPRGRPAPGVGDVESRRQHSLAGADQETVALDAGFAEIAAVEDRLAHGQDRGLVAATAGGFGHLRQQRVAAAQDLGDAARMRIGDAVAAAAEMLQAQQIGQPQAQSQRHRHQQEPQQQTPGPGQAPPHGMTDRGNMAPD